MKTISFIPINKAAAILIPPPIPAHKQLPEWYKRQNAIIDDKLIVDDRGVVNTTIKKCMPVLDDMSAGYYVTLASDVQVAYNHETGNINFNWSLDINGELDKGVNGGLGKLISTHSTEQVSQMPLPPGYSVHPFKWENFYRIKTPKGYSCLFRHPSWVFDLPFYTFSGLVDTDKHPINVNFPFIIQNGWEGTIVAGTPIAQVIPFKRTEWQSEVCFDEDNTEGALEYRKSTRKLMHRYKDNWRSFKSWK